ncbi:unnamed protein product [Trichogramma brassicae]|uniref:Midasin n=1 Tax=Trichogramma brassicae TaxID=86971 RepID=A0A6H5IR95_9HYME|nr:unnamed protein product [Trichogramma brassicae]
MRKPAKNRTQKNSRRRASQRPGARHRASARDRPSRGRGARDPGTGEAAADPRRQRHEPARAAGGRVAEVRRSAGRLRLRGPPRGLRAPLRADRDEPRRLLLLQQRGSEEIESLAKESIRGGERQRSVQHQFRLAVHNVGTAEEQQSRGSARLVRLQYRLQNSDPREAHPARAELAGLRGGVGPRDHREPAGHSADQQSGGARSAGPPARVQKIAAAELDLPIGELLHALQRPGDSSELRLRALLRRRRDDRIGPRLLQLDPRPLLGSRRVQRPLDAPEKSRLRLLARLREHQVHGVHNRRAARGGQIQAWQIFDFLIIVVITIPMDLVQWGAHPLRCLVKALKEGYWILLDEINLANSDTLECLSGLLEGACGSLSLLERGDREPIKRHPDFTIFACMNPATDVGKKELPVGLRNRFTEFYVDELEESSDLLLLVNDYLKELHLPINKHTAIVKFYLSVRSEATHYLFDGTAHKPVYSLRTLCRALSVAAANPCITVLRSLYEALCLSFLTQLDHKSYPINPPGRYGGRKVLSRAFRNRFVELHFDEIPTTELQTILHQRCAIPESYCKQIIAVMQELQVKRKNTATFAGKRGFITLRDLFRWAERYRQAPHVTGLYDWNQHLADEGYLVLAAKVRKSEEAQEIREIIKKHLKRDVNPDNLFTLHEKTSSVTRSILEEIEKTKTASFKNVVWTCHMRRMAVLVRKAYQFKEPVLLVGETGGGKTTVCQIIAHMIGRKLYTVNCHMHTESSDFLGNLRPVRSHDDDDRLFEWVDGPLVQAMQSGNFFLADEISLADDGVVERLNSLLEPERSLLLAEKGTSFDCSNESENLIVANDKFFFLGTMNPGGDYSKKELSPALRNRFSEIWCDGCHDRQDLKAIMAHNLSEKIEDKDNLTDCILNFAEWLATTDIGRKFSVSIRDLLTWTKFVNACVEKEKGKRKLTLKDAYFHGACLTFIDSLGSGMNNMLSIKTLKTFKNNAFDFLKLQMDKLVESTLETSMDIDSAETNHDGLYGISPFYIERGELSSEESITSFTFQAPTTQQNCTKLLRALQLSKPILLEGSPGVGKTSLVSALAQASGHSCLRINLSDQTDISDLFGADLPVEGGKAGEFSWKDGPFLRALKAGQWILLDEMNLASQSVLEGLNACFDHRGQIYIPELEPNGVLSIGERGTGSDGNIVTVQPHENFRLFFAMDPKYGEISRAMRNRGVEIFLLPNQESPETFDLDRRSLLHHTGLTKRSHQEALMMLHKRMCEDITNCDNLNVIQLLHAAFLVVQQLSRAFPAVQAFESSCKDVYIRARSIFNRETRLRLVAIVEDTIREYEVHEIHSNIVKCYIASEWIMRKSSQLSVHYEEPLLQHSIGDKIKEFDNLVTVLNQPLESEDMWSTDSLDQYEIELEKLVNMILIVIQNKYKNIVGAVSEKNGDNANNKVDGKLRDKLIKSIEIDIKALKLKDIHQSLNSLLKTTFNVDQRSILSYTRLLQKCLPLLRQYLLLAQFYINEQTSSLRLTCKILHLQLNVFLDLANNGFCIPDDLDLTSSDDGEQEKGNENGMKLDDGEGQRDVSDQVGNENQLEEATLAGQEGEKLDDEDSTEKNEGIERSENVEEKPQDVDEKDDDKEEGEASDLDKQTDDIEDVTDKLDEKIWGEDEEKLEEIGNGEQSNTEPQQDSQGQNEEIEASERDQQQEINEIKEPQYDEDQVNPSHGQMEAPTEPEELNLPENINIDEIEIRDDEPMNEENPFDLDKMRGDMVSHEPDIFETTEEVVDYEVESEKYYSGDDKHDPEKSSNNFDNYEVITIDEDQNMTDAEVTPSSQKVEKEEENGEPEPKNKDEDENQEDKALPKSDEAAQGLPEGSLRDTISKESNDNLEFNKESNSVNWQDVKDTLTSHTLTDQADAEKKRKNVSESDEDYELTENNEPKQKKIKNIINARNESAEDVIDVSESDCYEVDNAVEKLSKEKNSNIEREERSSKKQPEVAMDVDVHEDEKIEPMDEDFSVKDNLEKVDNEEKANDSQLETPAEVDIQGEIIETTKVSRGDEVNFFINNTPIEPEIISSEQIESRRVEVEKTLSQWVQKPSTDEALAAWNDVSAVTNIGACDLAEKLRLVLEPSQATSLKGDYRTDKVVMEE